MTKREMKMHIKKEYAAARKLVSHKSLGLRIFSLMKNVDNFVPIVSHYVLRLFFSLNKLLIFLYFLNFYMKSMNKNKVKIETS